MKTQERLKLAQQAPGTRLVHYGYGGYGLYIHIRRITLKRRSNFQLQYHNSLERSSEDSFFLNIDSYMIHSMQSI